jgi:tRNA A37 methylthiotransferase MiaB
LQPNPEPKRISGKLHIKTFGCQVNEYDSAKMAEVLRDSQGFMLTARAAEADVILLNTCSVREKAQEKCFRNSDAGASSASSLKRALALTGLMTEIDMRFASK